MSSAQGAIARRGNSAWGKARWAEWRRPTLAVWHPANPRPHRPPDSDFWAIFGYVAAMPNVIDRLSPEEIAVARKRRLEAMHLQVIEGNPFDEDDVAMFEMFEREGWNDDQCIAYILAQAREAAK